MNGILSIQYLRAIAALSVVIFHIGFSFGRPDYFVVGKAGVDLFFVISGFIMFIITETKDRHPVLFLWRRLARIVPLYWLVTLVTVALIVARPLFGGELSADIRSDHVVASLLFHPRTNSFGVDYPTLRPGWTLNMEMFFYIIMAAVLCVRRQVQPWVLTIALFSLVILGIAATTTSAVFNAYTNPLLLEFLAGMWIGRLWLRRQLPSRTIGIACVLAGVAVLAAEHFSGLQDPGSKQVLYWGIPAISIVLGALAIESHGGILAVPLLKRLGDASYSIYLLHTFAIAAIIRAPLPQSLQPPAVILLTVAISFVSFYCFERPVHRLAGTLTPFIARKFVRNAVQPSD